MGPRGEYLAPAGVNYDLWLGPAPREPLTRRQFHHDWQWLWAYGNGDLGGASVLQLDLARWGLGASRLSDSVISFGGRFGVADAGETATTQVVIHNYGARSLVSELRQLEAGDHSGGKAGVILEGTEGYLVATSYDSGAAFDKAGKRIRDFQGGGDHFANFLKAVRSRNARDLTADIEEGHLSSALCHLGNISYRLGEQVGPDELARRLGEFETAEEVQAVLARTLAHLDASGVDVCRERICLGLPLRFDPVAEVFLGPREANRMLTREYRQPFVVPPPGQI